MEADSSALAGTRDVPIDELDHAIVTLAARITAATHDFLVLIRRFDERRDPERGTATITVELPLETAELIDKALDRALEATVLSEPEVAEQSWAQQRADALLTMAKAYLGGNCETSSGTPDHYQVVVHVDHTALKEGHGRSGLPIESVRRIVCDSDSDRIVMVEDEEGEPLTIGRKSRVVPAAIRRALWARDRSCRFPGCERKRFVDAHHVKHWSTGGETSLSNLMLLCTQHHQLVHEGGFRIEKDYSGHWFFKRPDGRAVPPCGYRAADMIDDDVETGAGIEYSSRHPSAEGWRDGISAAAARACAPGSHYA